MIKPIQTKYKGYLFRSRLEARWAVYFDKLGIKWEYEKEGFEFEVEIKDGCKIVRYLPDFWLPDVNMWAEVKPEKFNEIEYEKAKLLAKYSGYPLLMLIGIPDYKTYNAIEWVEDTSGNKKYIEMDYLLSNYHGKQYPKCEGRFYSCTEYFDGEQLVTGEDDIEEIKPLIEAARSERFEFK